MNASSNRGGVGATFISAPATAAAMVSALASGARTMRIASPWMTPSITPCWSSALARNRPPTTFHPRELEDPSVDATGQFGRRPREQQLAVIEKEHAIAGLGLVEIGRRPHNPDALLGQVLDHLPEFAARNRIDADARLVEEKQTRFLEERAGKAELLLHTARQLAGEPTRESLEIRQGEKPVERRRALGLRQPAQIRVQVEIFLNRQVLVEAESLRHIADGGLNSGRISTSVEAEHFHGPFVWQHEPGHNADQRRLAGAVRPDQPGDFAAPDRSGHRVERGRRGPEALGDLRQLDQLGGRANVNRSGCAQDEFPPCSPRGTSDGDRHALAQPQVGIFDNDPQTIHEVGPEVRSLDGLRRELRHRRYESDRSAIDAVGKGVGRHVQRHSGMNPAEVRFRNIGAHHDGLVQRQHEDVVARRYDRAGLANARQDDAVIRGAKLRVVKRRLRRQEARFRDLEVRAGRGEVFGACAFIHEIQRVARRRLARLRRVSRHGRLIEDGLRNRAGRAKLGLPFVSLLCVQKIGCLLGVCGSGFRDFVGTRPGHELVQRRPQAGLLRFSAANRVLVRPRVEVRQQRACFDRIALVDEHFSNPPADAKAKPHLPNVDVSIERQMVVLFMRPPEMRGKVEPPRSRSTRDQKENQGKGELLFHVPAPCLRAAALAKPAGAFRAEKVAVAGRRRATGPVRASILGGWTSAHAVQVIESYRPRILRGRLGIYSLQHCNAVAGSAWNRAAVTPVKSR